jgi:hypothetical protein
VVSEGKVWHRAESAVAHDEHVAARQLKEPLNIGDILAAATALPRQTAAKAELAAKADGDDGADIGDLHQDPGVFSVSSGWIVAARKAPVSTHRQYP